MVCPAAFQVASQQPKEQQNVLQKLQKVPTAHLKSYDSNDYIATYWKYLFLCFNTPRPSEKEEMMRNRIADIAKGQKLDYEIDGGGNIRVRKPATKGCENAVRVCIQCHIDMVCSKTKDSKHDFDKDPLEISITDDGKSITANQTTLGSDDGVGVAAALMLLEQDDIVHGPQECLFTVEEETRMAGAQNLAPSPYLQSQALINVDSEEIHSICVGCAGGSDGHIFLPVQREDANNLKDTSYTVQNIELIGFVGGHTGIDIHRQHGNAIICLNTLLLDIKQEIEFRLISQGGGNAANAIPRNSECMILIPSDKVNECKDIISKSFDKILQSYGHTEVYTQQTGADSVYAADGDIKPLLELPEIKKRTKIINKVTTSEYNEDEVKPLTIESTARALSLIDIIPHGVIRWTPNVKGEVDTSNSFSLAYLPSKPGDISNSLGLILPEDKELDAQIINCYDRSFSEYQKSLITRRLESIATVSGAKFLRDLKPYCGWEPNTNSLVFKSVYDAHRELFPKNDPPKVYSVHAGLECGPILAKYPSMHIVSIGPTIHGAHSPDEQLDISSIKVFVDWLICS